MYWKTLEILFSWLSQKNVSCIFFVHLFVQNPPELHLLDGSRAGMKNIQSSSTRFRVFESLGGTNKDEWINITIGETRIAITLDFSLLFCFSSVFPPFLDEVTMTMVDRLMQSILISCCLPSLNSFTSVSFLFWHCCFSRLKRRPICQSLVVNEAFGWSVCGIETTGGT